MLHKFLSLLLVMFFQCALIKTQAQNFELKSAFTSKHCSSTIFYGVNNKMRLVNRWNETLGIKRISLISSDSIHITKVNDSIYFIRPDYKNVHCKIYIINTLTAKKIDSLVVYCNYSPFVFSISTTNLVHSVYSTKEVIENMKLYMASMQSSCYDFTNDYSIWAYQLLLKRNDTTILIDYVKANQGISNDFKRSLKDMSRSGDVLFAKNIILLSKDGRQITIDEVGLWGIH